MSGGFWFAFSLAGILALGIAAAVAVLTTPRAKDRAFSDFVRRCQKGSK